MKEPYALCIKTPGQYQYVFFKHMDFYAERNGLTKEGRKLSTNDVRQIFNDVSEEVRQLYKVPESEHVVYKGMMELILFGKDKGRKGNVRK